MIGRWEKEDDDVPGYSDRATSAKRKMETWRNVSLVRESEAVSLGSATFIRPDLFEAGWRGTKRASLEK